MNGMSDQTNSGATVVSDADLALSAYHALDDLRYLDQVDRVLARHGDDVDVLYPDPAELADQGADLTVLYAAMQSGMSPAAFGSALAAGVDLSMLSRALSLGLEPGAVEDLVMTYGAELGGHIANYVESKEDEAAYPDPVDRVMARLGE